MARGTFERVPTPRHIVDGIALRNIENYLRDRTLPEDIESHKRIQDTARALRNIIENTILDITAGEAGSYFVYETISRTKPTQYSLFPTTKLLQQALSKAGYTIPEHEKAKFYQEQLREIVPILVRNIYGENEDIPLQIQDEKPPTTLALLRPSAKQFVSPEHPEYGIFNTTRVYDEKQRTHITALKRNFEAENQHVVNILHNISDKITHIKTAHRQFLAFNNATLAQRILSGTERNYNLEAFLKGDYWNDQLNGLKAQRRTLTSLWRKTEFPLFERIMRGAILERTKLLGELKKSKNEIIVLHEQTEEKHVIRKKKAQKELLETFLKALSKTISERQPLDNVQRVMQGASRFQLTLAINHLQKEFPPKNRHHHFAQPLIEQLQQLVYEQEHKAASQPQRTLSRRDSSSDDALAIKDVLGGDSAAANSRSAPQLAQALRRERVEGRGRDRAPKELTRSSSFLNTRHAGATPRGFAPASDLDLPADALSPAAAAAVTPATASRHRGSKTPHRKSERNPEHFKKERRRSATPHRRRLSQERFQQGGEHSPS